MSSNFLGLLIINPIFFFRMSRFPDVLQLRAAYNTLVCRCELASALLCRAVLYQADWTPECEEIEEHHRPSLKCWFTSARRVSLSRCLSLRAVTIFFFFWAVWSAEQKQLMLLGFSCLSISTFPSSHSLFAHCLGPNSLFTTVRFVHIDHQSRKLETR